LRVVILFFSSVANSIALGDVTFSATNFNVSIHSSTQPIKPKCPKISPVRAVMEIVKSSSFGVCESDFLQSRVVEAKPTVSFIRHLESGAQPNQENKGTPVATKEKAPANSWKLIGKELLYWRRILGSKSD